MSKVDHNLMTPAAYARHRGCTRQAVREAVKAGRITPTFEGLVDPVAADAQWAARTRPRITPGAGAPPATATGENEISYREARRRQAVAAALMAEREQRRQAGELVRVADVALARQRAVAGARDVALGMSARLAPLVAAEADAGACARLIETEVNRMLSIASGAHADAT
jgi:hypothetical protein